MQNNYIKNISPSVRLLTLILLMLCIVLANSIYLISFMTILIIILAIITNKQVKFYVNTIKNIMVLLLIILLAYIIMLGEYNVINIILVFYKLLLIAVLIKIFIITTNFRDLHEGLYGVMLPLKQIDIEKYSFDIALSIYFIKFLIQANKKIKLTNKLNGYKNIDLKNRFLLMLTLPVKDLEDLQFNLKVKLYKLNYKKMNLLSKIILVLTLCLFITCVFKEVIL